MYPELGPYLRCPACGDTLSLSGRQHTPEGDLLRGECACIACGAHYPIVNGILDFLGPARPTSLAGLANELAPTASAYERLWRPHALSLLSGEPFGYARELPLIIELIDPTRGGLFLDLACSTGLYARTIARELAPGAGHVIGIDYSLPMLREARRRTRAEGLRISYVRASAQAMPLAPGSAAGIAVGGSLNEIGDLDAALQEMRRLLADQGRFVAMTLTSHPRRFERALQAILTPGGLRFWTSDELRAHFERQKLHVIQHELHGIVLFTLAMPA